MPHKRGSYSPEFKEAAVREVIDHPGRVSKLTRHNADAIAELVTASAGAAHELLD